MRELENHELENIYGGGILAGITIAIGLVITAVAAYKLVSAESAKIKLPGGTDISFQGAKGKSSSSKTQSISQNLSKSSSKQITLNQLDNTQKSFSSTPRNFLVRI